MTGRPGSPREVIAWSVVAAVLVAVAARSRPVRRLPLAISVRGVERWILIAAYPVALAATLARRRALSEVAGLRRSRLWTAYTHRRVAPRPEYHGAATFSRFPLVFDEVLDVAGSPMLRTDLATPYGRLRVVNVHTVAPLTREQARRWERQMAWLGAFADADASPVILAGDFKATGDHVPFRRLVAGVCATPSTRSVERPARPGRSVTASYPRCFASTTSSSARTSGSVRCTPSPAWAATTRGSS